MATVYTATVEVEIGLDGNSAKDYLAEIDFTCSYRGHEPDPTDPGAGPEFLVDDVRLYEKTKLQEARSAFKRHGARGGRLDCPDWLNTLIGDSDEAQEAMLKTWQEEGNQRPSRYGARRLG